MTIPPLNSTSNGNGIGNGNGNGHSNGTPRLQRPSFNNNERSPTYPSYNSTRKKPRRWPLVLRFVKGAIHADIALAVFFHAGFTALICFLDGRLEGHGHLEIPSSVVPSLSIVVGLMLVFRNSTSYDRFWQGNQLFTTVQTNIRNLTRSFLACSHSTKGPPPTLAEKAETERAVRILLVLIYAAKNHLRAEWGGSMPSLPNLSNSSTTSSSIEEQARRRRRESTLSIHKPEYTSLLPPETLPHEESGLSLLLQLSIQIEIYIKRSHDRGWFHSPQASQMQVQLNSLVAAYGSMETIHLTPLPVAYLIHMRQVLALFCCVLPFALVGEMGWWSVVMVTFVAFTLYGIEAIGKQLEDPFGYDRADIKVDAIVEDLRVETTVLLDNWRRNGDIFPEQTLI